MYSSFLYCKPRHYTGIMEGIPAGCIKAFVQRDYSDGMTVKFEKSLPRELEGKVSVQFVYNGTKDRTLGLYHC